MYCITGVAIECINFGGHVCPRIRDDDATHGGEQLARAWATAWHCLEGEPLTKWDMWKSECVEQLDSGRHIIAYQHHGRKRNGLTHQHKTQSIEKWKSSRMTLLRHSSFSVRNSNTPVKK